MLSNPEFVKNNTPYFKYFKLLGDKLGVKVNNDTHVVNNDTHVVSNDNTYKVSNDTPLNTTLNKDDTESDSD
jgi:hypothetical protein